MEDRGQFQSLKTDPSGDRLGDSAMNLENKLPVSQTGIAPRPGVSLYSHYIQTVVGRQVFADGLLDALGAGVGIFCTAKASTDAETAATAFYAHYPRAVSSAYGSITGICPGHLTLGVFQEINPTPGFPGGSNIRFVVSGTSLFAGAFKGGLDFIGSPVADNSIWRTDDTGTTWTQIHDGSDFDTTFYPFGFGFLSTSMYAWGTLSGGGGATYKSTDNGVSWSQIETHVDGASWGTRSGFGSCVFGSKLWIIGGTIPGSSPPRQSDVWSSSDGITWNQVATAQPWGLFPGFGQVGRTGMGTAATSSAIFIAGGQNQNNSKLSDCWSSTNGITWVQTATSGAFQARATTAMTQIDGALILYAGYVPMPGDSPHDTPQGLDDVWVSSDSGVTWTQVAGGVFPAAGVTGTFRSTAALAVVNGSLILAGGVDLSTTPPSGDYLTDVWASPSSTACVYP